MWVHRTVEFSKEETVYDDITRHSIHQNVQLSIISENDILNFVTIKHSLHKLRDLLQYYAVDQSSSVLNGRSHIIFIICPIAIAYSMGQIIKSVCVCVRVCVCVCVCVCPSASTLTVAFLDRFSPKLAQT